MYINLSSSSDIRFQVAAIFSIFISQRTINAGVIANCIDLWPILQVKTFQIFSKAEISRWAECGNNWLLGCLSRCPGMPSSPWLLVMLQMVIMLAAELWYLPSSEKKMWRGAMQCLQLTSRTQNVENQTFNRPTFQ